MKIATTLFLKIAVILIGILVLTLCIFLVPELADAVADFLGIHSIKYIIFILLYGGTLPFLSSPLYQAVKLLSYIDKNIAFSELSVRILMRIKYCAISICSLHVLGLPVYISWQIKTMPQVSYLLEWSFLCFVGYRSFCCCSPKAFARSD